MDAIKLFITENLFWFVAIPLLIATVAILKHYFPIYQDDNIVEEKIEEVIEKKTGLNVDITPQSPEVKNVSCTPTNETQNK